jgi:hypothetical protein
MPAFLGCSSNVKVSEKSLNYISLKSQILWQATLCVEQKRDSKQAVGTCNKICLVTQSHANVKDLM